VLRSLSASFIEVGGLAFMSEPSSAATSSTEFAPKLSAMRFQEPNVLMATGKGEGWPLKVGFSMSSAWLFHFAVGELSDFQFGGEGLGNAGEFARLFQRIQEITEGIVGHMALDCIRLAAQRNGSPVPNYLLPGCMGGMAARSGGS
jgi:hypothetical protein